MLCWMYIYFRFFIFMEFPFAQCAEILLSEIFSDVDIWYYCIVGLWIATICDVCSSPACRLAALTHNSIREIQLAWENCRGRGGVFCSTDVATTVQSTKYLLTARSMCATSFSYRQINKSQPKLYVIPELKYLTETWLIRTRDRQLRV
jgi:hypothetical protein